MCAALAKDRVGASTIKHRHIYCMNIDICFKFQQSEQNAKSGFLTLCHIQSYPIPCFSPEQVAKRLASRLSWCAQAESELDGCLLKPISQSTSGESLLQALDRTRPQTNLPLDGKTHCFRASLLSNVNRPILACEVHAYLMHMHLHESDLSEDTSEARS